MKRFLLIVACFFASTVFFYAHAAEKPAKRAARRVVAPAPVAPADSIVGSTTECILSVVADSTDISVTHEMRRTPELDSIDSIAIHTTHWSVTRNETMRTIEERITYVQKEVDDSAKVVPFGMGHYIQFGAGVGTGTFGSKLTSPSSLNGFGLDALGQVQYAYFFHPNWGVSAGLGFSTYGGSIRWKGEKNYLDQTDSDGELYNHKTTADNWREAQRTLLVDLPIALQYKHMFSPSLGLYAAAGVNVGFPVKSTYRLTYGTLTHTGYYDRWHMEVTDWRDFYEEHVGTDFDKDRHALSLKSVQAAARTDLGVILQLNDQWDLLAGAYFRYTMNDMQVKGNENTEMAWMHTQYEGDEAYKNHTFMGHEYCSMIETNEVSAVRPWQVGVKLGVQWHYVDKKKHAHIEYEPFTVYDTTTMVVPRTYEALTYAYDTLYSPEVEIIRLMETAIIWFDLDSYVPKIDPVDILDRIAAILVAHPTLKCNVNGHTCTIGKRAYNQRLSEKRAKAVADILISLGVKKEQLMCHGYCSDIPYFSASHQLYLDRRCEIIPVPETNEEMVVHEVKKSKKK